MTEKIDIKSLDFDELKKLISNIGERAFRAEQIYQWLHQKGAASFDEMTNLSKQLREKLNTICAITCLEPVKILTSKTDGTKKFLFRLEDGNVIESVWMKYHYGNSVCISTQAGCRMGCRFCASAINGLERNLTPSEMLDEVYSISRISKEPVSHIVLMGSGEPLDNYENVLKFIDLVTDEKGQNISSRNITLSTCGLVPQIYRLADEKKQITLAISLHAPDDETRKKLMPIANKYSIDEILEACRYYFEKTGRRISFEYSLAADINDNLSKAERLSERLKGMNCHVNLIPVNPVKERHFQRSGQKAVLEFRDFLVNRGIQATIRREMGSDIHGACGQLRKSYQETANRNMMDTKEGDI